MRSVSARRSAGERQVALVGTVALVLLGSVGLYAVIPDRGLPLTAAAGWESWRQKSSTASSAVDELAAAMNSQAAAGGPQRQSEFHLASVDEMIDRLAEWLSLNPKDTEAWCLLGWSYFSRGRFAESAAPMPRPSS